MEGWATSTIRSTGTFSKCSRSLRWSPATLGSDSTDEEVRFHTKASSKPSFVPSGERIKSVKYLPRLPYPTMPTLNVGLSPEHFPSFSLFVIILKDKRG